MSDLNSSNGPSNELGTDNEEQRNRYLTFRLENEDYGLDIEYVKEIVGVQKITLVPDMPEWVKGVINLRGTVIPVMDVRARFRREPRAYDDRTCVIVVNLHGSAVGLIVDSVSEVVSIPADQVTEPPRLQGEGSRYVRGIGKVGDQIKILLDVQQLLGAEEVAKAA